MKMAQIQELKAEAREGKGKGPAYQARAKGLIPGIVYGGKDQPQPVSVDFRTLERHVEAGSFLTTLFMLDVAGKKTRVIPRQLQLDPVSDRPTHVDFMRLAEGATIRLEIPVHFKGQGESPGLKKGGVLNIVRHEMNVLCPADNIPKAIDVDVSKLDINGSLHLTDLTLPPGVKALIRGRDVTICSIVAPTSVIEEQKAAAEAAAAALLAPVAVEGAPVEGAPAEGAAPAAGAAAAAPAAAGAKGAPAAGAKAAPAAPAKK
jgi:large subunit ribosomal protein L25